MSANHPDPVVDFVVELLRTGLMLTDLASELLEVLPEDGFPGEDVGDVVVQMLAGSIRPAAEAVGAPVLRQATALMGAARDRTLADLEEAQRRLVERDGLDDAEAA